jgi:hypothetical protein
MASDDAAAAAIPRPTVFLSYATQDREAARTLQGALSSYGLEVWLDESELGGGDAWDQKIRRQIRECQYFMPVVSAQTESRAEGYFRREWRLAVERTLDMADDHLFLLPVAIDDTDQAGARVPEKFLAVQWLKLPGGRSTPALEALCRRIVAGGSAPAPAPVPGKPAGDKAAKEAKPAREFPAFPVQGQQEKWAHRRAIAAWAAQSTWIAFRRLPRWVQVVAYLWLGIVLLSHGGKDDSDDSKDLSPAKIEKIKDIAQHYEGNADKADIAKLGLKIAQEVAGDDSAANSTQRPRLLAIPFLAPPGNAGASRFADSAFAMTYGRLALSRHGHVGLSDQVPPSAGLDAAIALANAQHASYVLYGAIDNSGSKPSLSVSIAKVDGEAVQWTNSYPLAGADAAKIAADVEAKAPALDD